jgi:hypothetical protein
MKSDIKKQKKKVEKRSKPIGKLCPSHGQQPLDYCDRCARENLMDNQIR